MQFPQNNFELTTTTGFTLPVLTLPMKYVCWFTNTNTKLREICIVDSHSTAAPYEVMNIKAPNGIAAVINKILIFIEH